MDDSFEFKQIRQCLRIREKLEKQPWNWKEQNPEDIQYPSISLPEAKEKGRYIHFLEKA